MSAAGPQTVPLPSAEVLGVRVHRVSLDQAVDAAGRLLRAAGSHQVVTLNAVMLVQAVRDPQLRRLFNAAALVLPDGVGVLLAGRMLGTVLPHRVAGIDFCERLVARCAEEGRSVYLLGGAPGVAAEAAAVWQRRYPSLQVAGAHHGYLEPAAEAQIAERIATARPALLLVGMGSPRQERWIARHAAVTGAALSVGVGGTFDVVAGRLRRAPRWMQRAGLEWLFRFWQEPGRWRVVATLPLIVVYALRARLARMLGGASQVPR